MRACILSRVCAGITQVPLVPAVPCNTALSADLRFPPPLPPRHLFYFIFVGAGRGSTTHARLTRGRAAACAGAGGWLVSWSDGWPVGAGWMAWVRAHEYVCMRPGALCAPPNTVRAVWEDGAVELSGRLLTCSLRESSAGVIVRGAGVGGHVQGPPGRPLPPPPSPPLLRPLALKTALGL